MYESKFQIRHGSEMGLINQQFNNKSTTNESQDFNQQMQHMQLMSNKRGSVQSQDKINMQQHKRNNQLENTDSVQAAKQNITNSLPKNKEKQFIIKKSHFQRIKDSNNHIDSSLALSSSMAISQMSSPINSRKQSTDPLQTNKIRKNLKIQDFQASSKNAMRQSRQHQKKQIFSEQNSPIRDQFEQLNIQIPTVSKFQDQHLKSQQRDVKKGGISTTPNNQYKGNNKCVCINKNQSNQQCVCVNNKLSLQTSEQQFQKNAKQQQQQNRRNNYNNIQHVSAKSSMISDDEFNDSYLSSQYFLNNRGDGSPESDQLAMRKRKNFQSFEKTNLQQNFPKRQVTQNFEAKKKRSDLGVNIDAPQSAEFKLRDTNIQSQNGSNRNNNQSSTFETTINANPAILALSSNPQFSKDQSDSQKYHPNKVDLNQDLRQNQQQNNQQYASVEHIVKLQQEIDRLKHLVKQKDIPSNKRAQNLNSSQDLSNNVNGVFQKRRPGTSNRRSPNLMSYSQIVSPSMLESNNSGILLNQSQSSSKDNFFHPGRQLVSNQQIRKLIQKKQLDKKMGSSEALQNPLTPDSELVLNLEGRQPFQIPIPERIRPSTSGAYSKASSKQRNRLRNIQEQISQQSHIILEHDPVNGRLGFSQNNQQIELDESHYHPTFIAKDIEEIRNNPEIRKVLKQFQLFSGVSHVDTKNNAIRANEQNKQPQFGDPSKLLQDNSTNSRSYQIKEGSSKQQDKKSPKNKNTELKTHINTDLITVYQNEPLKSQTPTLLSIPTHVEKDQTKSNSPRMKNLTSQQSNDQLQIKISQVQTPPMKSSRKANTLKQSVPIIRIQRSNSNSFLQAQPIVQYLQSHQTNINSQNRRDSDLLSVVQNLNAIRNLRRESHESNQYHQKLSLTSVLTPSFAKDKADTPSGKSDFSFAIKDMFSERSSGGSSQNFSEGRKKTISKALLSSHQKKNTLIMTRQHIQSGNNILRVDSSHDQNSKSRQIDKFSLSQQQNSSSNFSFHQHLTKDVQLNLRPSQVAEKQMQKIIVDQQQQVIQQQQRKQPYEYLQSKQITCCVKVLQPNHIYKGSNIKLKK